MGQQTILMGIDYDGKPPVARAVTLHAPVGDNPAHVIHGALIASMTDAFGPEVVILNKSSVDDFIAAGGEWVQEIDDVVSFVVRRCDLGNIAEAIYFWGANAGDDSEFWARMKEIAGAMAQASGGDK